MKTNCNLINIKNFFRLICFEQNATREEVINFLNECLKYVFSENDLNVEDFIINFHFIKEEDRFQKTKKHEKKQALDNKLFAGNVKAIMMKDPDNDSTFDIYFPAKFASVKVSKDEDHKKHKPESTQEIDDEQYFKALQRVENLDNFLEFIFTVFHEYAHTIQYIKSKQLMKKLDSNFNEMELSKETIETYMPNSRKKRLLLKTLNKYFDAQGYIAEYEQDADKQAYEYFVSLVAKIINMDNDTEFFDFLSMIFNYLDRIKKNSKINNYIYEKLNAEAIQKLDELNFEEELLEITKGLNSN